MRKLPPNVNEIFKEAQKASLDLQRKNDKDEPTIKRQVRKYELITPLFGGGVEPTKADPITTVRVTEIRGQLRFWWRAIRGGQFGSDAQGLQRMKLIENAIWGAASTNERPSPSQVQIVIDQPTFGELKRYSRFEPELQYAAFPLQKGDKSVLQNVAFVLHISFPRQIKFVEEDETDVVLDGIEAEVNAALWAWETFGGVGARTRRGFGAIKRLTDNDEGPSAANSAKAVRAKLVEELGTHIKDENGWPKDVPHLCRSSFNYRVTEIQRSDNEAWKIIIGELKKFRQQRPEKKVWSERKRGYVKAYGRSHWPEADAIRQLTKQWLKPKHAPKSGNSGKFPRAVFGLPIVFHFKDNNAEGTSFDPNDDPRDIVLKLDLHDRLASPLILRPLCISKGQYVGLAILLEGGLWPEDFCSNDTNLVLAEKDNPNAPYIAQHLDAELVELVTGTEADAITEYPSGKPLLGNETDPLIAFLNRIQKEDS